MRILRPVWELAANSIAGFRTGLTVNQRRRQKDQRREAQAGQNRVICDGFVVFGSNCPNEETRKCRAYDSHEKNCKSSHFNSSFRLLFLCGSFCLF